MILIQEPRLGLDGPCAYIEGLQWRFEYFFARGLDEGELDELLSRGWRKFGEYYFRPRCAACSRCIPLRVRAGEFAPTRSQRRIMRNCAAVEVRFGGLSFREEIFEVYRDHSLNRFGKESDRDDFITSFYSPSCPGLQSEYYLDGNLIAVGFLDRSGDSLSSVYFVFRSEYKEYRLGSFSVIKEVEFAASLGLHHYYLGYYIAENRSMEYKGHFHPHEKYDWADKTWKREA